jgi:hypothetical protein
MNKIASSEPSTKGSCLNVCALQSMTSLCKGAPVKFSMTLLAYAAVVGQTEMVKCLTDAGAGNDRLLPKLNTTIKQVMSSRP